MNVDRMLISPGIANNNDDSDDDYKSRQTAKQADAQKEASSVGRDKEQLQPAFNLNDIGTIHDQPMSLSLSYNGSAVSRRGRSRSSPVVIGLSTTAGSIREAPTLVAEKKTGDAVEVEEADHKKKPETNTPDMKGGDAVENYKLYMSRRQTAKRLAGKEAAEDHSQFLKGGREDEHMVDGTVYSR